MTQARQKHVLSWATEIWAYSLAQVTWPTLTCLSPPPNHVPNQPSCLPPLHTSLGLIHCSCSRAVTPLEVEKKHPRKDAQAFLFLSRTRCCTATAVAGPSSWSAALLGVCSSGFSLAEMTLAQRGLEPPPNNLSSQYSTAFRAPVNSWNYLIYCLIYCLSPSMPSLWEPGLGFVCCCSLVPRHAHIYSINKCGMKEGRKEWEGIKIHTFRLSCLASFTDEIEPFFLKRRNGKAANATLPS